MVAMASQHTGLLCANVVKPHVVLWDAKKPVHVIATGAGCTVKNEFHLRHINVIYQDNQIRVGSRRS